MEEGGTVGPAGLRRRELMLRGGQAGLAAAIASALPVADRIARPATALAQESGMDWSLQAFFDTMIPGRPATVTTLGNPIHPQAIAGVDPEPGAVEADALALGKHPRVGFETIAPPFVAELESRAMSRGGPFLGLDYERREQVCLEGLDFDNPSRALWHAAAAVAFTAFCAAATLVNPTRRDAVGYQVMGHPGIAPRGYRGFSYRRRLNRGRTKKGNLG